MCKHAFLGPDGPNISENWNLRLLQCSTSDRHPSRSRCKAVNSTELTIRISWIFCHPLLTSRGLSTISRTSIAQRCKPSLTELLVAACCSHETLELVSTALALPCLQSPGNSWHEIDARYARQSDKRRQSAMLIYLNTLLRYVLLLLQLMLSSPFSLALFTHKEWCIWIIREVSFLCSGLLLCNCKVQNQTLMSRQILETCSQLGLFWDVLSLQFVEDDSKKAFVAVSDAGKNGIAWFQQQQQPEPSEGFDATITTIQHWTSLCRSRNLW